MAPTDTAAEKKGIERISKNFDPVIGRYRDDDIPPDEMCQLYAQYRGLDESQIELTDDGKDYKIKIKTEPVD